MFEITKYPDKSSYITVKEAVDKIVFKLNTYEDLWHLNQLVDAYNNLGITPDITIPNLIDAQADRRFNHRQSSGLKLVCKFLNEMKANFKIFHPHNPEVVEALIDNVEIIDNSKFIKNVFSNLYRNNKDLYPLKYVRRIGKPDFSNIILMSADAGGFKPLMKLCDKINWTGETASCNKYRYYENDKTILKQGVPKQDFEGKDILIVDDICVYGGTFKGLVKMLREHNVGKLYLAVSHITIQNHKNDHIFGYFNKVFTTNSKYDEYYIPNSKGEPVLPKNLRIIKMF